MSPRSVEEWGRDWNKLNDGPASCHSPTHPPSMSLTLHYPSITPCDVSQYSLSVQHHFQGPSGAQGRYLGRTYCSLYMWSWWPGHIWGPQNRACPCVIPGYRSGCGVGPCSPWMLVSTGLASSGGPKKVSSAEPETISLNKGPKINLCVWLGDTHSPRISWAKLSSCHPWPVTRSSQLPDLKV